MALDNPFLSLSLSRNLVPSISFGREEEVGRRVWLIVFGVRIHTVYMVRTRHTAVDFQCSNKGARCSPRGWRKPYLGAEILFYLWCSLWLFLPCLVFGGVCVRACVWSEELCGCRVSDESSFRTQGDIRAVFIIHRRFLQQRGNFHFYINGIGEALRSAGWLYCISNGRMVYVCMMHVFCFLEGEGGEVCDRGGIRWCVSFL